MKGKQLTDTDITERAKELFRIMHEIVRADALAPEANIAFMLDQCHNIGAKILAANAALMDAYNTEVRPLLKELREDMGLDPDPVAAYRRSGYPEKIRAERVGGQAACWGA
jgi:L-rhamnose isomerase/sugar isomerase